MKRIKIIPFIFTTIALTACAVPNYATLEESKNYKVFGRTAIKHPAQSGQVNFSLEQAQAEPVNIVIQGPFAQGRVDIVIDKNETILKMDDATYTDSDPDKLFAALTGINWPVSNTQNWIKGRTNHPNTKVTLDNQGLPKTFTEDGWKVTYDEWIEKSSMKLPLKMTLNQGNDIRLRFLVTNWLIQ